MPKQKKRPEPEKNEEGKKVITFAFLQKLCDYHDSYHTPKLVDNMYLSCVGFRKIENLEEYYDLKSLYLDGNGIRTIENLGFLTQLRGLYLHNNCISEI